LRQYLFAVHAKYAASLPKVNLKPTFFVAAAHL
jgi:hypothetical protein